MTEAQLPESEHQSGTFLTPEDVAHRAERYLQNNAPANLSWREVFQTLDLPPNTNPKVWLAEQFVANRSLLGDALFHFFQRLPKPTHAEVGKAYIDRAEKGDAFTREEERALRKLALDPESDYSIYDQIEMDAAEEVIEFNSILLRELEEQLDTANNATASSIDLASQDLQKLPQISTQTGDVRFGFYVKHGKRSRDYYVMDPEKNGELSEYILTHPALVKYLVADEIIEAQRIRAKPVSEAVVKTAELKLKSTREHIFAINSSIEVKLIQLLRDVLRTKKEFAFGAAFHSDVDLATIQDAAPAEMDRRSTLSHLIKYHVRLDGDGNVEFFLPQTEWKRFEHNDEQQYHVSIEIVERDGHPCVAVRIPGKQGDTTEVVNVMNPHNLPETLAIEELIELFQRFLLINVVAFMNDSRMLEEARAVQKNLLSSPDIVTFFQVFNTSHPLSPKQEFTIITDTVHDVNFKFREKTPKEVAFEKLVPPSTPDWLN